MLPRLSGIAHANGIVILSEQDMISKQTYCKNQFKYLVTLVVEIRTLKNV